VARQLDPAGVREAQKFQVQLGARLRREVLGDAARAEELARKLTVVVVASNAFNTILPKYRAEFFDGRSGRERRAPLPDAIQGELVNVFVRNGQREAVGRASGWIDGRAIDGMFSQSHTRTIETRAQWSSDDRRDGAVRGLVRHCHGHHKQF
jgi:hypothetical protein